MTMNPASFLIHLIQTKIIVLALFNVYQSEVRPQSLRLRPGAENSNYLPHNYLHNDLPHNDLSHNRIY